MHDRCMLGLIWIAMIGICWGLGMIDAMLIVRCMLMCVSIEFNFEYAFSEIKM